MPAFPCDAALRDFECMRSNRCRNGQSLQALTTQGRHFLFCSTNFVVVAGVFDFMLTIVRLPRNIRQTTVLAHYEFLSQSDLSSPALILRLLQRPT
jgi:hypothetical protein